VKVWILIEESKLLERTIQAVQVDSMTFTRRMNAPDEIVLQGVVVGAAPWPGPMPDIELKEITS
jgi:hypothetical protein